VRGLRRSQSQKVLADCGGCAVSDVLSLIPGAQTWNNDRGMNFCSGFNVISCENNGFTIKLSDIKEKL
jgi:hypothetical protein